MTRTLLARLRDDGGVGVVELLTAITLMGLISGLLVNSVVSGMGHQRQQTEYVKTLNEVKLAFERTTRELRAADAISPSGLGPHSVNLRICRGGAARWMTFSLDTTTSPIRYVVADPTGTPPRVLSTKMLAPSVAPATVTFQYFDAANAPLTFPPPAGDVTTTPERIRSIIVRLRAQVDNSPQPIDLQNRITLRNTGGAPCA